MICNQLQTHWMMCQNLRSEVPTLQAYGIRYFRARVRLHKDLRPVEQKALTHIRVKEIRHEIAI